MIFDNLIPDVHKCFIYYGKYRRKITKEEFAIKMKKLKATKKAMSELEGEDKLFYELLMALNLDKEQKKQMKVHSNELDIITEQYHQ